MSSLPQDALLALTPPKVERASKPEAPHDFDFGRGEVAQMMERKIYRNRTIRPSPVG